MWKRYAKRRMSRIGGCFKLALDGCFGSEDAALTEGYANNSENHGLPCLYAGRGQRILHCRKPRGNADRHARHWRRRYGTGRHRLGNSASRYTQRRPPAYYHSRRPMLPGAPGAHGCHACLRSPSACLSGLEAGACLLSGEYSGNRACQRHRAAAGDAGQRTPAVRRIGCSLYASQSS